MQNPTTNQYEALEQCYSYFNKILFSNQLTSVLFTTQRKHHMLGYYSPKRYRSTDGSKCDEIAINPDYVAHVSYIKLMQTIVHEMTHCWQFHFGTPSRGGYHNKQWANKMRSIGLIPSNTGKPGGKELGQQMNDYPEINGHFMKACITFLNDKKFPIQWADVYARPILLDIDNVVSAEEAIQDKNIAKIITPLEILKPQIERVLKDENRYNENIPTKPIVLSKSKVKYSCPSCKMNLWGKPGLYIICGECNQVLDCKLQAL